MAGGLRLDRQPALAWVALACAWALASLGVALWRGTGESPPALAWAWYAAAPDQGHGGSGWPSWWTAALVHRSGWHLAANLAAAAAVAAWGWTARVDRRAAAAWLLAWPLSQALLVTDPGSLSSYAGLSAVLHAGVAIACWHVLRHRTGAARRIGLAVGLALLVKVAWELPTVQAGLAGVAVGALTLPPVPGAPGHVLAGHAHACGVAAGWLAALALDGIMATVRRTPKPPSTP